MENKTDTLSLKDQVSEKLLNIRIENSKQVEMWTKVQQQVNVTTETMRSYTQTVSSLQEKIEALYAQSEWISETNIDAISQAANETEALEERVRNLETAGRDMTEQSADFTPIIKSFEECIRQLIDRIDLLHSIPEWFPQETIQNLIESRSEVELLEEQFKRLETIQGSMEQLATTVTRTMKSCQTNIEKLQKQISSFRSQPSWMPEENILTITRSSREVEQLDSRFRALHERRTDTEQLGETVSRTMLNCEKRVSKLKEEVVTLQLQQKWVPPVIEAEPTLSEATPEPEEKGTSKMESFQKVIGVVGKVFKQIGSYVKESEAVWMAQVEKQNLLAGAMIKTMGAGNEEINSIIHLAAAQQKLGVITKGVQLSGAHELAQHIRKTETLQTLLPVMNDMLATEHGLNATQENAVTIAHQVGEAMKGHIAPLIQSGYQFTEVQKKIMRYGTESERAATLAEIVTQQVGGMNEALAATPEGKIKKQAEAFGALQARVGKLFVEIKTALSPVFEMVSGLIDHLIEWMDENQNRLMEMVYAIVDAFQSVYPILETVLGGIFSMIDWVITKFQEGNPIIIFFTNLLGALAIAISLVTVVTKIWSAALMLNPVMLIVTAIIALIGTIAYLCYKLEGWGTVWEGLMGFMKHTYEAFIADFNLGVNEFVDFFMTGLNKIQLGWYKFKQVCGLGDSAENQAAINQIHADMEARKNAIQEGIHKVEEHKQKAVESLKSIDLRWNSEKSVFSGGNNISTSTGIEIPGLPGMDGREIGENNHYNSDTATAGTVNAISGGGTRNNSISITLRSLVENLIFEGGYEGNREDMFQDLETQLIRVLHMAKTAL